MKYVPGEGGGGHRPPGVRNKLSHRFLTDVMDHWKEIGPTALRLAYRRNPMSYVQMIAGILPKEVTLEHTTSGMSAEERDELIVRLREHLLSLGAQRAEQLKLEDAQRHLLIEAKVQDGPAN